MAKSHEARIRKLEVKGKPRIGIPQVEIPGLSLAGRVLLYDATRWTGPAAEEAIAKAYPASRIAMTLPCNHRHPCRCDDSSVMSEEE